MTYSVTIQPLPPDSPTLQRLINDACRPNGKLTHVELVDADGQKKIILIIEFP